MNYTPTPGFYLFEVRFTNSCGTSTWFGDEVEFVDCTQGGGGDTGESRYVIYPNPSSNYFTVQKISNHIENDKGQLTNDTSTTHYTLYDFTGNLVLQGALNESVTINVATLKKGEYILKQDNGVKIETRIVLIE